MIINGGSRCNARFFAQHLVNAEENEKATLCELRNLAAQTVPDAFCEMSAIAMGTLCRNFFYHANINPLSTEALTPAQWQRAVNLLEENLRLTNHARLIVEHDKKERVHRHVIWLRIAVNKMRAVEMTDDFEKHQATARQLEREFGLESGTSVLGQEQPKGMRPARRPKSWETFRGHKSGVDPQAMTELVTGLFHSCADAGEFATRLRERGLDLVPGDRRDYCIIDSVGHLHSLARRLQGVSAPQLKAFLGESAGTLDQAPT